MSTYYLILGALLAGITECQLYNIQTACHFNKNDLSDAELTLDYVFNKVKFLDYRSNVNRFTGYTQFGKKLADSWNNERLEDMQDSLILYKFLISIYYKHLITFIKEQAEPSVHLKAVAPPPSSKHTTMLKCSAYRFYPQEIRVTWTRKGQNVTSDMVSTEELYYGNLYFLYHSYLEYTPTPGEEVSCMVEHASLPHPRILHWDPSMPVSERVQVGIGVLGVFLGLVVLTAGSLYYKRRPIVVVETPSTVELQSTQEPNSNVIETLSQEACM